MMEITSSKLTPIEAATRAHNWVYAGYVLVLLLAAFFTWYAWRTGNRVQEAIRADADARIAEADSKAQQAKEGAAKADEGAAKANEAAGTANANAATANERATKLEAGNLQLRGQVATLELQSAHAKSEVARLQIDAATATQRAAAALAHLEELSDALAPRMWMITGDSQDELRLFEGQKVFIVYAPGDEETKDLAGQIAYHLPFNPRVKGATVGGGWEVLSNRAVDAQLMEPAPGYVRSGVNLLTRIPDQKNQTTMAWNDYPSQRAASILCAQLRDSKIACNVETPTSGPSWPKFLDEGAILVQVGRKPDYWMGKMVAQYVAKYQQSATGDLLKMLDEQATQFKAEMREREKHDREERQRIITEELARRLRERHNP
ncbi:MAG TPA: hypothetical protein VI454_10325 [Verrucomicrobiae bacterium]